MASWFVDISEILTMRSNECAGTVEYMLEEKTVDDKYHQAIKREMEKAGYNIIPVYIDEHHGRWWFYNGHHRVRIAVELGHTEILVTDDPYAHRPDDAWTHTVVPFTGSEHGNAPVPYGRLPLKVGKDA